MVKKRMAFIFLIISLLIPIHTFTKNKKVSPHSKRIAKHSFELALGVVLLGSSIISILNNHFFNNEKSPGPQLLLLSTLTLPTFMAAITLIANGSEGIDNVRQEQLLEKYSLEKKGATPQPENPSI